MDWLYAHDYDLARQVLQRGIGVMYLIAFCSTAAQFRALLGEHGLLPVPNLVHGFMRGPSLFRWRYSDRMLLLIAAGGIVLAASVILGLPQLGPPWVPMLVFLAMYGLYLSIVNVGQTFYSFGWESLILEAGFLAAFLGSNEVPPPTPILVLFAWLVFRLEFGAGMIKMRGDRVWRDLTALYYHHETQPMPNPVSRLAHHLPKPVHKFEVLGNHFAQLIVPWLLFFPQPIKSGAAVVIILTQLWLVITGNFAWLNWITIVLAFCGLSDTVAHWLVPAIPLDWGAPADAPLWWLVLVWAVTAFMVVLSYWPARNLMRHRQLMNASFNGWHLVNAYGAFGSITRPRYEVIVEGTLDEHPDSGWREYEFKGKPGNPLRMPRQYAPYHLRLDWLMWFLPLRGGPERWFMVFLTRLLEADNRTLRMLRLDPFDGERPRWVRARLFLYRFSTRAEKRATGAWWVREEVSYFVPPMSLTRTS